MAEATAVSFRKGSTVEHQTFRGVEGEVTVDLDQSTVWVHLGNNEAGTPLARADMKNVEPNAIADRGIALSSLKNITISNTDLPDIKVKLDIPTKTSQLQNDSDFVTENAIGKANISVKVNNSTVDTFNVNAGQDTYINIPVPSKTSDLNNDAGFITNTVGNLVNYTKTTDLASVATSGAYSDLSGTPSLATVATSGAYADLTGTPNLAPVATSGAYADLTGTPPAPVQSNWNEETVSSLAYIQNKPILVKDIVVTPVTGVISLYLSESFIDSEYPNATPTIKALLGGATIGGTWADVAGTTKKEWTFTPTTANDILAGSWVITLDIDEG